MTRWLRCVCRSDWPMRWSPCGGWRAAPRSPLWFGPETVLVCQLPTRSRVLSNFPEFPQQQMLVEELPVNDQGIGELLRRIDKRR